ncbi:MAG TPA: response regulator [Motilibacteraceae bacterium]|nr:response regulator [Motilibacteraceae bacterium]
MDSFGSEGAAFTVLVADDSPTLRRIVSTVLEREGFRCVTAQDGVEAVQAAFRLQPDVVVMDVQMPRVSGYVAARLLKDDWQTADIPIVVLTSLDAASDRYWGLQTGADRFLTKDFEAPELVEAVREVLRLADERRAGRPAYKPEPVDVGDDEVLARVSELLDRKLFEASVSSEVTAIAADVHGFEETVAAVLQVLARVVDYDIAAVLLLADRATYVTLGREVSAAMYTEFFGAVAEAAGALGGAPVAVQDLVPRVADPHGWLGADDEGHMATFLSMPLRVRGQVIGALALASATKNAFGESALSTLRLVESPAAVVIDSARLSGVRG